MNPLEIKELVAKARIEDAVKAIRELTRETELENIAVSISQSQRTYKQNDMMGIWNTAEKRQEQAIITSRILLLLNEYEILQINSIKSGFGQLKSELANTAQSSEFETTINNIDDISSSLNKADFEEMSKEEKADQLGKVGTFLSSLAEPDSKTGQVIQMIKNGVDIAQDIAKSYNSVAEWVGLPVVPRFFLKKD